MIYFDNAATTFVEDEVWQELIKHKELGGNPSSQHYLGKKAKIALEGAREKIASFLDVDPECIIFTSGGSESNNLALNVCNKTLPIVTSMIEHPSVLEKVNQLEEYSLMNKTKRVPVDSAGIVNTNYLFHQMELTCGIASIMMVNNEVGSIQPLDVIGQFCEMIGMFFHTDAVQAFGHMPIDLEGLNIGAMSVSGHKFGGLRGTGFLYLRDDYRDNIIPVVNGGGQEFGLRSGTENVLGAIALAKAVEVAYAHMDENYEYIKKLNIYLRKKLLSIPGIRFNSNMNCYPGILNVMIYGAEAQQVAMALDLEDVYVSTGSACHSNLEEPSRTLKMMGVDLKSIASSIRISINHHNTKDEVDKFVDILSKCVERVRGRTITMRELFNNGFYFDID